MLYHCHNQWRWADQCGKPQSVSVTFVFRKIFFQNYDNVIFVGINLTVIAYYLLSDEGNKVADKGL